MQLELPFGAIKAKPEVVRGGIRMPWVRWVYEYERAKLFAPRNRYARRDLRGRFY